jgi:peroxiredoxin-like protein
MTTVATRPRTFTYRTTTEWLGRRNGRFHTPGKEAFIVSSPPEFRGEDGFYSPEELFVGAIEICLMLTFAALAEKHNLPVEAYYSEAEGTLERADGEMRFTRVLLKPTVIVSDAAAVAKTLQTLSLAHRECMIANSVRAEVKVEPEVLLSGSE